MEEDKTTAQSNEISNGAEKAVKVLTPAEIEKRQKMRRFIIIAAAIIIPALTIFIWKQVQIHKLQKSHESEISTIKQSALDFVKQKDENNLRLVTRILSWAVSDAIKGGKLNEAGEYIIMVVKEQNFKQIQVVSPEGIVILSTDKKTEGSIFANPFPEESFLTDSLRLRSLPTGDYMTASSMYNIDKRHGVIVITAAPDVIKFD